MKRIALALIACAGLGYVAGQKPSTSEDVVVIACTPAPTTPVVDIEPPVEQPQPSLVEKLIPKPTIADGQLSPRGEWRWSQAQGAWVPVAKAGPRWVENGHSATIDHLVRDHGYRRADLTKLTQYQLDTLHSNSHNSARARRVSAPTYSACPSGRCPRR